MQPGQRVVRHHREHVVLDMVVHIPVQPAHHRVHINGAAVQPVVKHVFGQPAVLQKSGHDHMPATVDAGAADQQQRDRRTADHRVGGVVRRRQAGAVTNWSTGGTIGHCTESGPLHLTIFIELRLAPTRIWSKACRNTVDGTERCPKLNGVISSLFWRWAGAVRLLARRACWALTIRL